MERQRGGFELRTKADPNLPVVLKPESYSYANHLRGSIRRTGVMLKWLAIGLTAGASAATLAEYLGFSSKVAFSVGAGVVVLGGIALARELSKIKKG